MKHLPSSPERGDLFTILRRQMQAVSVADNHVPFAPEPRQNLRILLHTGVSSFNQPINRWIAVNSEGADEKLQSTQVSKQSPRNLPSQILSFLPTPFKGSLYNNNFLE